MKFNIVHEENVKLQSQLDIVRRKLEQVQVENKRLVEKYREMKDKKQHDVAIQVENIKLDETYEDEKQHDFANQANLVCI